MKKEKVGALRRWEPASWWELVGRNGWTLRARHICQDATAPILIRDLSRNPCGDYLLHSHTEFTPAGSRTRKQGGERREKWFNQAQNEISFEFCNAYDWSGKLGYSAKWDLRQKKSVTSVEQGLRGIQVGLGVWWICCEVCLELKLESKLWEASNELGLVARARCEGWQGAGAVAEEVWQ